MKVLITGAGGFLGTTLVRMLYDAGYTLTILDRLDYGAGPLLSALAPCLTNRYRVVVGDVRDPADVKDAWDGCDVAVHLAGIVGYPACDADPVEADTVNVEGTRTVCRFAEDRPVLFASTGSCYGKVEGLCTEQTPIAPLTRYGRNKAAAERLVLDVGGLCLRFATLFGLSPRMRWDLLPNDFCRRALSGSLHVYEPDARRTFLHVEDAAEACRYMLNMYWGPAQVYNVGSRKLNLTKGDIAGAVSELTDCTLTLTTGHDPDQRDYEVDYTKLTKVGWTARRVDLRRELKEVVEVARWRKEGR